MTWSVVRDWRFWGLLLAAAAIAIALLVPRVKTGRDVSNILFVIDITGSMNTRDIAVDGANASRLEFVKSTVLDTIQSFDCLSKAGLGLFAERRSFLLFEPVELCGNYDPISGALRQIDWRMAWEGDSYVTKGLYSAIELAKSGGWNLVFFTDGHEAPPIPYTGIADFDGEPGAVPGLIVGVGGTQKVPIPKFDADGREVGTWRATDVPQENRVGVPPENASSRPGWHVRNAPWGAAETTGDEHLTSRRDEHLEALASKTGLRYLKLGEGASLVTAMTEAVSSHRVTVPSDISRYPAGLALAGLAALFAGSLIAAWSRRGADWFASTKNQKGVASP